MVKKNNATNYRYTTINNPYRINELCEFCGIIFPPNLYLDDGILLLQIFVHL